MLPTKVGLLIAVSLVLAILVIANVPGMNGPWYWKWHWRPLPGLWVYLGMLLAVAPLFAGLIIVRWRPSLRGIALGLAMLSCFEMKLLSAFLYDGKPSFEPIPHMVQDPLITSYYTDAAVLSNTPLSEWMPHYADLMPSMNLHSKSKPPGPVLYFLGFIKLLGAGRETAMLAGIVLGALATVSIPATYLCLRRLLGDADAAFCGAMFLSLCPGFVLFFPMFDPIYILLSTGLITTWYVALREDSRVYSGLLGLILAATMLITFNVLVIGAFMIGLIFVATDRPLEQRIVLVLKHSAVAGGVAITVLVLLQVAIGYDVISTFLMANQLQAQLMAEHAATRPYPRTILFDLTDFLLGAGWICLLPAIYWLAGKQKDRRHLALVVMGLGQLVLVAATGLLAAETARVWNFMLPLMMIPVGLELSRWSMGARLACFGALALITAAVYQNMGFFY